MRINSNHFYQKVFSKMRMKGGQKLKDEKQEEGKITVERAAKLMGVSKEYVRMGLIQKRLPFGTAVRKSTIWTYHISPKLFYEYLGNNLGENEMRNVSTFTKIELLKYIRQFVENKKLEIAKIFLIQLIKYTRNEKSFNELNELLNCLNKEDEIYHKVVLEKLGQLLNQNEEELSLYFSEQDNPSNINTYQNVSQAL